VFPSCIVCPALLILLGFHGDGMLRKIQFMKLYITCFSLHFPVSSAILGTNNFLLIKPEFLFLCSLYVLCMHKGWAIKLALARRSLMIYCTSPLADAMIITVAALRIVLAHGSKPT
jgi:hypothetical protein